MTVKKGDKVTVDYTGTFDDGTVFDASEKHGQPLVFEAGSGQVIKGFDDAVIGMNVNEEKKISLAPDQAYGQTNPDLIQKVPKEKLPPGEFKPGMMLAVQAPTGEQFPVMIKEVSDKDVTIDMNHPMAGKNLNFKIKLIKIE